MVNPWVQKNVEKSELDHENMRHCGISHGLTGPIKKEVTSELQGGPTDR